MTLVELLIVISVAVLLMAAAVPLLRMPLQDRKAREGSRQLSAFIMRCKARAAELRRPVGLLLRRAANGTTNEFVDRAHYATQMYMVETPPPYTGDDSTAGARITANTPPDYAATITNSLLFPVLVAAGDLIRFDYKGPMYRITAIAPDPMNPGAFLITFRWVGHPNSIGPPLTQVGQTIPFQVYRSPYVAASGPASLVTNPPVELPNGIAVDLSVSGMGAGDNQFYAATDNDATSVIILFGPSGDVVRVYNSVTSATNPPTAVMNDIDPTGTIFLMVGRIDQVIPADLFARGPKPDPISNLMDASNVWVAIGHRTGKVTSAENSDLTALVPAPGQPIAQNQFPGLIAAARELARGSQNIGGR